jgi:hypothetical protein
MKPITEREPLAAAMIVRIVGYLVAILVVVGAVTAEQQTALLDLATILAPAAALLLDLIAGLMARARVTPMADPRTEDGRAAVIVDALEYRGLVE